MGSTEEVARMVTVLASDLASYVTGPSLTVDGGMVLYSAFEHGG
jgi:glucose 1-dehydrogenase